MPPEALDARSFGVLRLLGLVSISVGYQATLLTQTITFAAQEFGRGDGAQSRSLAVVRVGILISLALAALADRRGRRRIIVLTAVAAPIVAALGALSPNLGVLTATQAVGRPLALCLDAIIAVVVAEEMPKGSRAYAFGVLALATGFGSGLCVALLPLADRGVQAWRMLYVVPLVFLALIKPLRRWLPESRRYVAPHAQQVRWSGHVGRRFALLAGTGLCINLLAAPASGLQNEYLKKLQGYSATQIALFTIITTTPAAIGVLVGGELSDRVGRRRVGAFGLTVGAIATTATFATNGWAIWVWSFVGASFGGLAVPAIGVYQTELFPTAIRSVAKAGIVVVTLLGSTIGLLAAGAARDHDVSYGRIMTFLTIPPLIVALVILFAYPETAGRELEDLNPQDAAPAAT
jgi:MFS family permease